MFQSIEQNQSEKSFKDFEAVFIANCHTNKSQDHHEHDNEEQFLVNKLKTFNYQF